MKERLLVSACLTGMRCKYNGESNYIQEMELLREKYELIPVCAEILGGLTTPRVPSECRADGSVINKEGIDVTSQFVRGAGEVWRAAEFFGCRNALLKERSPSCGYGEIYDGTFSGKLIKGNGITAGLLEEKGIVIYGESRIRELL